ncbi:hypothetical protein SCHPADRAFT_999941 [Schizopora paradoxa]|uniref:Translation initiation factor 3 N-terminal domain-containing protein n=1 Tax=Schizopora paradoxa TaxID=27342 RepID=A0A0H2REG7_9AGAM|nr:hypothetical protein SCHPADRAFT_999941 [Schizopora paradoxa]
MFAVSAFARTQCARSLPSFVTGSSSSVHAPFKYARNSSIGLTRSYKKATNPKYTKPLRNSEIKFATVQLVNQETHRLDPSRPFAELLDSIDLKHEYVELVSNDPPIVKIINRREANAARKEVKERMRMQPRNEMKEVQMTWGVAAADLDHKLKKAEEELERGNRVSLVFAPRSKRPIPKPQELQAFLDEVAEKVSTFGRESQPRTLEKNVAVMYLNALKREKSTE